MISPQQYFTARQALNKCQVFSAFRQFSSPGMIPGKHKRILWFYNPIRIFPDFFFMMFPHSSECVHRLIHLKAKVQIAQCIQCHPFLISHQKQGYEPIATKSSFRHIFPAVVLSGPIISLSIRIIRFFESSVFQTQAPDTSRPFLLPSVSHTPAQSRTQGTCNCLVFIQRQLITESR